MSVKCHSAGVAWTCHRPTSQSHIPPLTLPWSQPDTCLRMWASVQTLSDTPSSSQAVPSNGRKHLTFRGCASWWEGNAGNALSLERKRKGQKPRRENEVPPAERGASPVPPTTATSAHLRLNAGRSVNMHRQTGALLSLSTELERSSFSGGRTCLPGPQPRARLGLRRDPQLPLPSRVVSAYAEQSRGDPLLLRK